MLGILIELIISWLLLWFFEKQHLNVLGILPTTKRIKQLTIGMLLAACFCLVYFFLKTSLAGNSWKVNRQFTSNAFFTGILWVLKSVIFEELIFRGALLYIAIKKMGINKACILSAACFGIYHWFSYGAFGNPVQMVFIFLLTAIAGFMFAYAFAKTGSLYLPIGLHFGWNFLSIVVFSTGPLGNQLLVKANNNEVQGTLSLLLFLFQVLALPLVVFWYLKRRSSLQR